MFFDDGVFGVVVDVIVDGWLICGSFGVDDFDFVVVECVRVLFRVECDNGVVEECVDFVGVVDDECFFGRFDEWEYLFVVFFLMRYEIFGEGCDVLWCVVYGVYYCYGGF